MLSLLNSRPLRLVGMAAAVLVGVAASSARADTINAFLLELTNSDPEANAIGVAIEIQDVAGGVQFSAQIRDIPGPSLGDGDILALWFDISPLVDLSLVAHNPPYDPSDLEITGFKTGHNAIGSTPWNGGPNINGMPAPFAATSPYDIAMRFGSNGMSANYYPSISFKLTNLTTGDFDASRFAARVTSIGDDNNSSGKYGGFVQQPPPVVPTPSAALGGIALAGLCALRRTRGGV